MLKNFRTYGLSVKFYRAAQKLNLPNYLKDQLNRASSSICLNLSEGYGRVTLKDKRRFYRTAMGSLRECQAILDISNISDQEIIDLSDYLGACLYKLSMWTS